jgi:hypothetical protein
MPSPQCHTCPKRCANLAQSVPIAGTAHLHYLLPPPPLIASSKEQGSICQQAIPKGLGRKPENGRRLFRRGQTEENDMKHLSKMMLRAGLATIALSMAGSAKAATMLFTLTGGAFNATWQLDSNPVPDFVGRPTAGISFFSVPGTIGGASATFRTVYFYAQPGSAGGLRLATDSGGNVFDSFGPQLYLSPGSAPTFVAGTYALDGFFDENSPSFTPSTLTIAPLTTSGAVPEPTTWAMMLAGFGLVGGAMRRKQSMAQVRVRYS